MRLPSQRPRHRLRAALRVDDGHAAVEQGEVDGDAAAGDGVCEGARAVPAAVRDGCIEEAEEVVRHGPRRWGAVRGDAQDAGDTAHGKGGYSGG